MLAVLILWKFLHHGQEWTLRELHGMLESDKCYEKTVEQSKEGG